MMDNCELDWPQDWCLAGDFNCSLTIKEVNKFRSDMMENDIYNQMRELVSEIRIAEFALQGGNLQFIEKLRPLYKRETELKNKLFHLSTQWYQENIVPKRKERGVNIAIE